MGTNKFTIYTNERKFLTRDLAATLHGESDLDRLELDLLLEPAEDLGHVEALPVLLGRHDGAAVLVGHVLARLALLSGAHALLVGLERVKWRGRRSRYQKRIRIRRRKNRSWRRTSCRRSRRRSWSRSFPVCPSLTVHFCACYCLEFSFSIYSLAIIVVTLHATFHMSGFEKNACRLAKIMSINLC